MPLAAQTANPMLRGTVEQRTHSKWAERVDALAAQIRAELGLPALVRRRIESFAGPTLARVVSRDDL